MAQENEQDQFSIVKMDVVGECKKCKKPTTGTFNYDDDSETFKVRCVSCHASFSVLLDNTFAWGWQHPIPQNDKGLMGQCQKCSAQVFDHGVRPVRCESCDERWLNEA